MARPTKYKPEYCEEILEYFGVEPYREVIKINPNTGNETHKTVANDLPTVERWATSIGVCPATVYLWRDKYPEFRAAFDRARALQVNHLLQNGLHGHFREGLAKFMLTNLSQYQEVKHVNQAIRDLTMEDLAAGATDDELEQIAMGGTEH